MTLSFTSITGTFQDATGNPLSGTATFQPNTTVYAGGVPVLEADVPIAAEIVAGSLKSASGGTLQLLDNGSTGLTFLGQTGFVAYTVTITIAGQVLPSWQFMLPHSATPVDLFSLANTGAVSSLYVPLAGGTMTGPLALTGSPPLEIPSGAASGKVLTSDSSGNASWQAASGGITPPAGDIGGTTSAPTVTGTHLSSPLPLTQGGTGAATQQAAINALTGSQTAGRYLRSDGTNSALAAIQAADVPTLNQNTTGTAANVTGTVAIANGGTGQTAQQAAMDALAGSQVSGQYLRGNGTHVQMSAIQAADLASTANELGNAPLVVTPSGALQWGLPWQFYPEAYGARGDGKVSGTGSATASSQTFTDPNGTFTGGDVGKTILINGALSSGLPLTTTISAVGSATSVTLAASATNTASNLSYVYGTDDTAAINSAVTAAGSYALAHNYFAQMIFGPKIYMLASGPTQVGNGSGITFNSQIPLPYPNANGSTEKLRIEFIGAGTCGAAQFWESSTPNTQGTALVSALQATGQPDGTHGQQSVIGGPTGSAGFTGGFANTTCHIDGLTIWCPIISQQYAFDFRYIGGFSIGSAGAQAFDSVLGGANILLPQLPPLTSFQASPARGLAAPVTGNNAQCVIGSFVVEGFPWGVSLTECCTVQRLLAVYTSIGVELTTLGGLSSTGHAVTIGLCQVSQSNAALHSSGSGRLTCYINLDIEGIGTADIQDAGAELYGVVRWSNTDNRTIPVVTGGTNLEVVNDMLGPGHWSGAPAVPASGTAVAASSLPYREAGIVVHTGAGVTVSAITMDGVSTGLTMAASSSLALPPLPGGKTLALTYAGGTPTWDWWLM